ncbi:MAG: hypothetical protein H6584_06015 [Flavobacteriales bacterium]|nr:hypothetical protein [Flavobacteriales bacterium]
MEIKFRTKEEANQEQLKEYLALSPIERIYAFLRLVQKVNRFPTRAPRKKNDNFQIVIDKHL